MAISLPDSRYLADDVIHALCLRALHARELGYTEQQIADILGVTRETVCRWWTTYTRDGLGAVPSHHRSGRPEGSRTCSFTSGERGAWTKASIAELK